MDPMRCYLENSSTIEVAGHSRSAPEKADKVGCDLILMDIHLGTGKNGLDATREIRKLPAYEHIPIVAVTGYTSPEDKNKIFDAGCSHYLGKPNTKKELLKAVEEAVGFTSA